MSLTERIKECEGLADELTKEDVTLILDGPGDPPRSLITSVQVLAYGADYLRRLESYREKVKRHRDLEEKYGGLPINIWLRRNPFYLIKREEERKTFFDRFSEKIKDSYYGWKRILFG